MCRLSSCPRRQVRCETIRPPLRLFEGSSGGFWCVELKREWPKVVGGVLVVKDFDCSETGGGGIFGLFEGLYFSIMP